VTLVMNRNRKGCLRYRRELGRWPTVMGKRRVPARKRQKFCSSDTLELTVAAASAKWRPSGDDMAQ